MKQLLVSIILVLVLAGFASAQVSKPINFYLGGGPTYPKTDWNEMRDYELGYHAMVAGGLNLTPRLQVLAKLGYHNYEVDTTGYNFSFKAYLYGAALKLKPSLPGFPLKLYGMFGLGFVSYKEIDGFDIELPDFDISEENKNNMYYEFGAGFEIDKGPLPVFAMIRYVIIQGDDKAKRFVPITIGLKF